MEEISIANHWDKAYLNSSEDQLGWFENDFSPSFRLINQCNLDSNDAVLLVGSGSSRLPDELLSNGLSELWVSEISEVALQEVKTRLGERINYRLGDILSSETLEGVPSVKLWFDRAVMHFFMEEKEQTSYFQNLKEKVRLGSYVIFAEFHLSGADKCSGLSVFRYDEKIYQERLGEEFILLDSFIHSYFMPSGQERPYIYALFQRKDS
ncbi:class I SAM-dependent methyltransferase [Algoriphagus kandeliae]|uniref:Class I SAM-dependent methyltransferase n=1 Tax=Algoriphagus kandeliae TaxID=2562278 RepID=A0A4Y9QYP8_9BACT|nr:class I SAM-dependent methyltransferase [Algoriphagus kandeliae]TFV97499.1 class I SAM-dependent methyltransferase [Algoriphagus kandeliae]